MAAQENPSTVAVIERALEDAIGRLSRAESSAEARSALIEARRLRTVVGSWHAIPPPDTTRREMLARVMRLTALTASSGAAESHQRLKGGPTSSQRDVESGPLPVRHDTTGVSRAQISKGLRWEAPATPTLSSAQGGLDLPPALGGGADSDEAPALRGRNVSVALTRSGLCEGSQPCTGVLVKVLRRDGATCTALVQLSPGATFPVRASGAHEWYVLEGGVSFGEQGAAEGDHAALAAGSGPYELRSTAGCTLLLIGAAGEAVGGR